MTPNEIIQSFDELYPGIREKYDGGLYQKKDIYLMMFPELQFFVAYDPEIGWYTCHRQYAVGVQTVEQLTKTLGKTPAEKQLGREQAAKTEYNKYLSQQYLEDLVELVGKDGEARLRDWDNIAMTLLGVERSEYYTRIREIEIPPELRVSNTRAPSLTAVR